MTSTDCLPLQAPVAKPGILDIQAYVPGKSKLADPSIVPVKLSSNENILGSSPHALEAFAAAGRRLNV
jgi:histidinol-phosphate aminotransferase